MTWAGFPNERFAVEADGAQPVWYASSPGAERAFCGRCGSPMFFRSTRWPGETHVARALFTDPLDREPSAHVFYETHVSWFDVADSLPKKVSTG